MALSYVQLNIESNYHIDRLEQILGAQPDVCTLQEVFLVQLKDLAEKYGYFYVFAPCVTMTTPGGKFAPLGEWGVAIMSKHPIIQSSEKYYFGSRQQIPNVLNPPHVFPRPLISITINVDNKDFTFATTHFTWALPGNADQVQAEDLSALIEILNGYPSFVLAGDFNAPRGGLVQKTLASKYPYYIPPSIDSTLDSQLFRVPGLKLVIDHLFATPDYLVTDVEVKEGYSDHRAIFATIEKTTN